MANPEHLEIVLEGSEFLKKWRKDNPDEKLKLSEADLSGSDLSAANLREANLIEANLMAANFSGADLRGANFSGANLMGANFNGADLNGADLSGAVLRLAKLRGAVLITANLNGADLDGADLLEAIPYGADLNGAKLRGADLNGADLGRAKLRGADLGRANLNGANLREADLNGANLNGANLNGVDLSYANLRGTKAKFSIVDGETLLTRNKFDRNTDFSGVGLDGARVEEELKSALKRNIRQLYWKKRYRRNLLYNLLRPFWWASDYGSSTTRLIITFLGSSLFFSIFYLIPYSTISWADAPYITFHYEYWTNYPFLQGLELNTENYPDNPKIEDLSSGEIGRTLWTRTLYFSIVTMTTLGFGDMSAHPSSTLGHVLVCLQVILGYVLLGALITRLSILFQEVQ